jgi:hypothetical protein
VKPVRDLVMKNAAGVKEQEPSTVKDLAAAANITVMKL